MRHYLSRPFICKSLHLATGEGGGGLKKYRRVHGKGGEEHGITFGVGGILWGDKTTTGPGTKTPDKGRTMSTQLSESGDEILDLGEVGEWHNPII